MGCMDVLLSERHGIHIFGFLSLVRYLGGII